MNLTHAQILIFLYLLFSARFRGIISVSWPMLAIWLDANAGINYCYSK